MGKSRRDRWARASGPIALWIITDLALTFAFHLSVWQALAVLLAVIVASPYQTDG